MDKMCKTGSVGTVDNVDINRQTGEGKKVSFSSTKRTNKIIKDSNESEKNNNKKQVNNLTSSSLSLFLSFLKEVYME